MTVAVAGAGSDRPGLASHEAHGDAARWVVRRDDEPGSDPRAGVGRRGVFMGKTFSSAGCHPDPQCCSPPSGVTSRTRAAPLQQWRITPALPRPSHRHHGLARACIASPNSLVISSPEDVGRRLRKGRGTNHEKPAIVHGGAPGRTQRGRHELPQRTNAGSINQGSVNGQENRATISSSGAPGQESSERYWVELAHHAGVNRLDDTNNRLQAGTIFRNQAGTMPAARYRYDRTRRTSPPMGTSCNSKMPQTAVRGQHVDRLVP